MFHTHFVETPETIYRVVLNYYNPLCEEDQIAMEDFDNLASAKEYGERVCNKIGGEYVVQTIARNEWKELDD